MNPPRLSSPGALLFTGLALVCASCSQPRRSADISAQPITKTTEAENNDPLWEAAQETLRRERFRLDRVDRRTGIITTLPETSKHYFEFWRHDVQTSRDLWEATLNPIRRWVEVTVPSGSDEVAGNLTVIVHKERLSSPDRQFNSSAAAYKFFAESLPSTTGLVRVTAEHDRWIDQGIDPAMQAYLLRAILKRAHGPAPVAANESQPGEPNSPSSPYNRSTVASSTASSSY